MAVVNADAGVRVGVAWLGRQGAQGEEWAQRRQQPYIRRVAVLSCILCTFSMVGDGMAAACLCNSRF